jgi:hypothetical protein
VAEVLFHLIVEDEVKNGMIYNFRKGINKVPVTSQKEKETFRVKCYNLLEPFLKQVD